MTEYETVIQEAEGEASTGQYKEAYNTLGRALALGGPDDQECRRRRGTYAYQVGHNRLDRLTGSTPAAAGLRGPNAAAGLRGPNAVKETLIKAGCWLARAEAYLLSASEGAGDDARGPIDQDLAQTKEEQERFRQLCRQLDIDLFSSGPAAPA
jgi:hypothetical protein